MAIQANIRLAKQIVPGRRLIIPENPASRQEKESPSRRPVGHFRRCSNKTITRLRHREEACPKLAITAAAARLA
jgi:hypothetical protein